MTLSARTPASLERLKGKWHDFLADPPPGFSLADAAYTTQVGRRPFEHRCAIAARDVAGLREALAAKSHARRITGKASASAPGVVLMFPGGGAHYPGAGRELLGQPAFQQAVDECLRAMPAEAPHDLHAIMFDSGDADCPGRRHPGPANLRHAGLVHARIRAGQVVGELGRSSPRRSSATAPATTSRPAWRA